MKLKRAKAYKKMMNYLHLNFHFREPYQILVDEEIVLAAVASKYDLVAGFERTLQGKIKVLIPQCVMEHLYRAKTPEAKEAIRLAKTFERRRTGQVTKKSEDEKEPEKLISAYESILECVGPTNKNRYIVATQKPKLRAKLRNIPAVPLIYINRSVMIMEPMSPATEKARKGIEQAKLVKGLNEVTRTEQEETGSESTEKRKKTEKGPNPLSVKKRTRPSEEDRGDGSSKKRRKRGKKQHDENAGDAAPEQEKPQAQEIASED